MPEITLTARSIDKGGITGSFDAQLKELGAKKLELRTEEGPYRVDSSAGAFYFEVRRVYSVTL